VLVTDLLRLLERLAPDHLAEPWDNCGLLVGDASAPVHRVLGALELTEAVLEEAIENGCDVVLTHHPLLFSPVRSLVESRPKERLLRGLVRHGVTLISCHTNLDAAPGGIADIAAGALGLREISALEPAASGWVKFVGFVPGDAVERVAAAVFAAGAGGIGNYSECAFAFSGRAATRRWEWLQSLREPLKCAGRLWYPESKPLLWSGRSWQRIPTRSLPLTSILLRTCCYQWG
jgi:putative NIF3 family GTP cyclohydrolase 1 type 2